MPSRAGTHTLLVLRHAHRATAHPGLDNGLSRKGREQAARILKLFKTFFGRRPRPVLLSSPKRRCLETLRPIARWSGVDIDADERLLEQRPEESLAHFDGRVRRYVAALRRRVDPLIVVCGHGDWIPLALRAATGGRMRLKKGGWAQVETEDGGAPRLTWLLQKLD